MKELYRFRQFLTESVTADEIASRVRKLGKEKGIEDEYIEDYIDELDGNFEPDAYENSTDKDLLDDLKSYIDLSEGKLLKEDANSIVNLLMKNQKEVADKLNYTEYFPFDEVSIDGVGDASIVLKDEVGGLAFKLPEDVDDKFVGDEGDKPRPITIGGVDLMYIGYNI